MEAYELVLLAISIAIVIGLILLLVKTLSNKIKISNKTIVTITVKNGLVASVHIPDDTNIIVNVRDYDIVNGVCKQYNYQNCEELQEDVNYEYYALTTFGNEE